MNESNQPPETHPNHYTETEILTQAQRLLEKFGGARGLARALKAIGKPRDPASIYRWTYPKYRGGSEGLIPMKAWSNILEAARFEGIFLTTEDMDPRPTIREIIRRKKRELGG